MSSIRVFTCFSNFAESWDQEALLKKKTVNAKTSRMREFLIFTLSG